MNGTQPSSYSTVVPSSSAAASASMTASSSASASASVPLPPTAPPPSAAMLQPPPIPLHAAVGAMAAGTATVAEGVATVAMGAAYPPSHPPTMMMVQPGHSHAAPLPPHQQQHHSAQTHSLMQAHHQPLMHVHHQLQSTQGAVTQLVPPGSQPIQPIQPPNPTQSIHVPQVSATAHHSAMGGAVTAESVLLDAINLPSNERVLFFNDLRLHLHREGLLSVRNRTKKPQPPTVHLGTPQVPGVMSAGIQKSMLRR
jgi:hypothetical protein